MLTWVARNGNIMEPRFYRLAEQVPRKFKVYRRNMRTYVQLWGLMYTSEPRQG